MIYHSLLEKGALTWLDPSFAAYDLSFLNYLTFIGSIAATVQIVEMVLDRFAPRLHATLGIFLPLITVNCAILGASLFMVERNWVWAKAPSMGSVRASDGPWPSPPWAGIRERLRYSNVPGGLRGIGLAFLPTGLMAMGFMAFGGIEL